MATRPEAAEALGVRLATLNDWLKGASWFPADAVTRDDRGRVVDWDIDRIRDARHSHLGTADSVEPSELTKARIALLQEQAREKRLTNEIAEIAALIRDGEILRASEYQQQFAEAMANLRESLANLPYQLARMFGEEDIQQYVKAFTRHTIEATLTELSDRFAQKAAGASADTPGTADAGVGAPGPPLAID